MDKLDFMKGIKLIEMFTGKQFPEERVEAYYMLLGNKITPEQYLSGLEKMFLDRVYTNIPAPAEILQYCKGGKKSLEIKIQESKDKLKKAITSIGGNKSIAFDDAILHKLIHMYGGWIKLCSSSIDDLNNYFKFEFDNNYRILAEKETIGSLPVILHGRTYLQNNNLGQELTEQVCYYGNKDMIIRWQLAYFNKNSHEQINKENYINLGYTVKPQLEYTQEATTLQITHGKELVDEILTKNQETKNTKPESFKIEYTPEQLKSYIPENRKKKVVEDIYDESQINGYKEMLSGQKLN